MIKEFVAFHKDIKQIDCLKKIKKKNLKTNLI